MNPLVSIIIPVRNGGAYLEPAIHSILNQTLRDFELIVVDDGSTDGTSSLLANFTAVDSRIRVLTLDASRGICTAINAGLTAARGSYIARMDADDLSRPLRLATQVSYLRNHLNIAVCGSWVRRFGEGMFPFELRGPSDASILGASMVFDNPLVHASVMFRGDLMRTEQWRYDERFRHAEDYDLWSRIAEHHLIGQIPRVLLDYRVHPTNITHTAEAGMDDAAQRVMRRLLTRLGIVPTDEEMVFHRGIATHRCEGGYTPQSLTRVRNWIEHLVVANRASGAFTPTAFAAAADQNWFACCYDALTMMPGVPQLYWSRRLKHVSLRSFLAHQAVLISAGTRHRLARKGAK
jgi:glycosyltransferase involved in cell wall biosynthesis